MPRKPRPGEGMLSGFIVDPAPFMSGMEYSLYEKVDQQTISAKIQFRTGVSRYPAVWLQPVLQAWNIANRGTKKEKLPLLETTVHDKTRLMGVVASLTDDQRAILSQVLVGGGFVKYQTVARKFGDEQDDSYFWSSKLPTSSIGQLRVWGLLFVGRMQIGQRREKVLVVPADLRDALSIILDSKSIDPKTSSEESVYELEVTLVGVKPKIFRRFSVPGTITLSQLSQAIQGAMGWYGGHLYEFVVEGEIYGDPTPDLPMKDANRARLERLISRSRVAFRYIYDYGDDWQHQVTVKKIRPLQSGETVPNLIGGSRACPPEDVGGIWGYEDFLRVLADPTDAEYENMMDWIGGPWDPEEFNREQSQRRLMAVARQGHWLRG